MQNPNNYSNSNEKKWMFLQDGIRAHASKETKAWMNEMSIELFPHPPNSPDLNPIEMVWALIK